MRRDVLLCTALVLVACPKGVPPAPRHVGLYAAPAGEDVAALVTEQVKKTAKGRTVLVYVGATWCEPCERFKHAAQGGQLDAELGDLDLLVFDADLDSERLLRAGYESRLIPLLVVPQADGRASDRRIEGSVKGDGAVANLVPRLKEMLRR